MKFSFEFLKKTQVKISFFVAVLSVLIGVGYLVWGGAPFIFVLEKSQSHVLSHPQNETVEMIQEQMKQLEAHITTEVDTLTKLYHERDLVMNTFTWFLDLEKQLKVHEAQMKINDQIRIIQQESESLHLMHKHLKPLRGIVSWDFAKDVGFSLLKAVARLHVLFPPVGFSLLSLLLLGPAIAALVVVFLSIGMSLLPVFLGFSLMLWLVHFPYVLLQYNPTWLQFGFSYSVSMGLALTAIFSLFNTLSSEEEAPCMLCHDPLNINSALHYVRLKTSQRFRRLISSKGQITPDDGELNIEQELAEQKDTDENLNAAESEGTAESSVTATE